MFTQISVLLFSRIVHIFTVKKCVCLKTLQNNCNAYFACFVRKLVTEVQYFCRDSDANFARKKLNRASQTLPEKNTVISEPKFRP